MYSCLLKEIRKKINRVDKVDMKKAKTATGDNAAWLQFVSGSHPRFQVYWAPDARLTCALHLQSQFTQFVAL